MLNEICSLFSGDSYPFFDVLCFLLSPSVINQAIAEVLNNPIQYAKPARMLESERSTLLDASSLKFVEVYGMGVLKEIFNRSLLPYIFKTLNTFCLSRANMRLT